jgi:hypothetical protein
MQERGVSQPECPAIEQAARTKAASKVIVGFFVTVVVCLFMYGLRILDFEPLHALVIADNVLYRQLIREPLQLPEHFHRIVFVDVDPRTIEKLKEADGAAAGTPRYLIAFLTRTVRDANAAVVVLDFDLRSHSTKEDDRALTEELKRTGTPPALLTTGISTASLPPCNGQTADSARPEMETVFNNVLNEYPVSLVHIVVETRSFGFIEQVCKAYMVRIGGPTGRIACRWAGMVEAIRSANGDSPVSCSDNPDRIQSVPIHWYVHGESAETFLNDSSGRLAYSHVSASLFVSNGGGLEVPEGVNLSDFNNAIVIIGATHRWSDDMHRTLAGDLSGAVVQANIALSLQAEPPASIPLIVLFFADVALAAAASCITYRWWWLPAYRRHRNPERRSLLVNAQFALCRITGDFLFSLSFGIVVFLIAFVSISKMGNFMDGWTFGLLSYVVGEIVVLYTTITGTLANWLEDYLQSRGAGDEPS